MRLILIPLIFALPACATDAVRPTAAATMRLAQGFKGEMAAFAQRQNTEIDARRTSIAVLNRATQAAVFRGANQRRDWRSNKQEDANRLFEEAVAPAVPAGIAGTLTQDPATGFTASAVAPDVKHYDALLKALKPLTKQDPLADTRFLIAFGQSVVDQMKKDLEKAAKAGDPAAPPKAPDPDE